MTSHPKTESPPAWRAEGAAEGSALLVALVILFVTSSLGLAIVTTATVGHDVVRNDLYREKAYYVAESGIEKALVELLRNPQFAGDTNVPFDLGSFSTTVRAVGENEHAITSIGTVRRAGVPFLRQRIVVRVTLDGGRAHITSWNASSVPVRRLDLNLPVPWRVW